MKLIKLINIFFVIYFLTGCFVPIENFRNNDPLSKQIIGSWSRQYSTNDDLGMPLLGGFKEYLEFREDNSHNFSSFTKAFGQYKLFNDTLVVFDETMTDSMVFKVAINVVSSLMLTKLNKSENNKFSGYEGLWFW